MTITVYRMKAHDGSYHYGVTDGISNMLFTNDEKDMIINEWDRLPQEKIMSSIVETA